MHRVSRCAPPSAAPAALTYGVKCKSFVLILQVRRNAAKCGVAKLMLHFGVRALQKEVREKALEKLDRDLYSKVQG